MSLFKKVVATVLAASLLVAAAAGFAGLIRRNLVPGPDRSRDHMEAYPRALEVPTEAPTEAAQPPETQPPETTLPEAEPEISRTVYETVPQFYMTDYPDVLFRTGTLANSGSSVASLAMVASYLTGYEYTPGELAEYFATYIGNSIQWLEYASGQLQLPWEKAANFHEARRALEDGKVVITFFGEKSRFGERFIVLTGLNSEGRITVNDPDRAHYDDWNLKTGLENGFEDGAIISHYRGSWIYDPARMPEEPFLYVPEENTVECRYPGIELTQADRDLMAKLIYMEAQSEPFEGQQAIAEVILNRLVAGNFQSSIHNIIHAQNQFLSSDSLHLAKPTHIQYEAIERALNGPYVVPIDVVFFASYAVSENVWGTIGNHVFCHQWDSADATEETASEGNTE